MTAQEAYALAESVLAQARKDYREHPDRFGYKLRFSWDGASAHNSAERDLSLLPGQLLRPPARSPDIQRVIEIPHSLIKKEFNKRLCSDTRVKSVAQAIRLLRHTVQDVVTEKLIKSLVNSLPQVYKDVIAHGGDWADKRWR